MSVVTTMTGVVCVVLSVRGLTSVVVVTVVVVTMIPVIVRHGASRW